MSTLIITDSRGRGLQSQIDKIGTEEQSSIRVLAHSGAGYELAILKSHGTISITKPSIIIVLAGICDLTFRNKTTKVTGLRFNTVDENVRHVMDAAKSASELLKSTTQSKVLFATLTGLDLADYNYPPRRFMSSSEYKHHCSTSKTTHKQQATLDMAVIEINRQITALNKDNAVPTVWTGGVVHLYNKRRHYHYYIRLTDGCHPDDQTKMEWARFIIKAIVTSHMKVGLKN